MTDLHDIISKQRGSEERDYAQRFHQEEINAIREIAENHEKNLKKEVLMREFRSKSCIRNSLKLTSLSSRKWIL